MKTLAKFYEHIDNGGISMQISEDDGIVSIATNTSYHGYPDIISILKLCSFPPNGKSRNQEEVLAAIGQMFLEASGKLKMQRMFSEELSEACGSK